MLYQCDRDFGCTFIKRVRKELKKNFVDDFEKQGLELINIMEYIAVYERPENPVECFIEFLDEILLNGNVKVPADVIANLDRLRFWVNSDMADQILKIKYKLIY